ncbi:class I SAM-dependent methyltransferase [Candidatus Kaiserbacteria bacterium]|nr:class I SAM-dependent methyltransferase [Candidatus Kaiserbacteria bacterium]
MTTDNFRKHSAKNPLQKILNHRFLAMLAVEAKKLDPERILDAGCGEGFTLEKLRREGIGRTLEGVDISEQALALGRKLHPRLFPKKGSVYELPYADKSFDLVICSEVLEHLEHPEKALSELHRVSKRYCIITVPHEPFFRLANFLRGKNLSHFGNDREHIQHWSRRGIVALARRYFGIKAVRSPFPWTIIVGEK